MKDTTLKFIALSGTTGVAENIYIYEYGQDMIIVDCGVGFPEPEMFGVDLVIPDFTYIKENKNRLKGILITHGHEDHIGALPFLLKQVEAPIYCTKLVGGFVEEKLISYGIKNAKVHVFNPESDVITLGNFKVTPFRISHSVPDGVGFSIDTPQGKIFHVADFKFDWTPVDGKPFDAAKLSVLASTGCLALACDSLGSTTQGYTQSEKEIQGIIENIAKTATGQIFFTTISSNISRIKQALNVAMLLNRKVSFIGRSIDTKAEIASKLGYLTYPRDLVIPPKQAAKYNKDRIMYVISGSYGQPGSALYRVALGEHDFLKAEPGDVVIFSSDPAPPGSKTNVDFVVDKFIESDIQVHYYDTQEDLHVSGHGSQEDIKMLIALTKPNYLIPIGGTIRHMRAYTILAQNMGHNPKNVFELNAGESVNFVQGSANKGKKIPSRGVLVDGLGIGDVGDIVLRDRHILSREGIAIAIIQLDSESGKLSETPLIISRGFVFEAKKKLFLKQVGEDLESFLMRKRQLDKHSIKNSAVEFLEKSFYEHTGRRPMVLPVVVEI